MRPRGRELVGCVSSACWSWSSVIRPPASSRSPKRCATITAGTGACDFFGAIPLMVLRHACIENGNCPATLGSLSQVARGQRGVGLAAGEPHAGGAPHRLGPAAEVELAIDVGQVVAHRLVADAATGGDGGDRLRLPDHGQGVELCWRQPASPPPPAGGVGGPTVWGHPP